MGVWRIKAIAENGQTFHLLDEESGPIFIEEGGLSGMNATRAETAFQVVGRDGQVPTTTRFDALRPRFNLVMRDWGAQSCGQVWADWWAAWQRPVTVVVEGGMGPLRAVFRRPRDASMDVWSYQPDDEGLIKLPWEMVSDDGLWFKDMVMPGPEVEVSNWGSSVVCPSVVWSRSGGRVTAGGDSFVLPWVGGVRRLSLDAASSYLVTDDEGAVDDSLWRRLRGSVHATPIFPGSTRKFVLPDNARLEWRIGLEHPWW